MEMRNRKTKIIEIKWTVLQTYVKDVEVPIDFNLNDENALWDLIDDDADCIDGQPQDIEASESEG